MRRVLVGCVMVSLMAVGPANAGSKRTYDWLKGLAEAPPAGSGTLLTHWFAGCEALKGEERAGCEGRREVIQRATRGQIYLAYSPLASLAYGEYNARKKRLRVEWTGELGDVPFDSPVDCTRLDQGSPESVNFPYWPRLATPLSSFFCGAADPDAEVLPSAEHMAAHKRIADGHLGLVQGKARRWPSLRGRHFNVRVEAGQAERLIAQGSLAVESVIRVMHPLEGWARCCGGKPSPLKSRPASDDSLAHIEGLKVQVLAFRLVDLASGAIYFSKPKSTESHARLVVGDEAISNGQDALDDDELEAGEPTSGGETRPARLVEAPSISLPSNAPALKSRVTVKIDVVVGTGGDVEEVSVAVGGGEPWDSHAEELALDLRYEPALNNGRPVQGRVTWEVTFQP